MTLFIMYARLSQVLNFPTCNLCVLILYNNRILFLYFEYDLYNKINNLNADRIRVTCCPSI